MRRVGDELAPRTIELLEAHAHPLECRRELSELVISPVDDRLVEPTPGNPLGRALEPPDPARMHGRERVADDNRHQQADHGGDEQPALEQVDARKRIRERSAQEDDGAVGVDHGCDLRVSRAATVDGAALEPAGLRCLKRDRIALDVE